MEELKKYSDLLKKRVSVFFDESLITKSEDLVIYNFFREYALRGKFIRGSLLLLVCDVLSKNLSDDSFRCATSLEILHSSILMIDDLIDRDDTRRGKPAMHVTVRSLFENSSDLVHDASSVAQCVALIGTYSAYSAIAGINPLVIRSLSDEFTKTGFAELNEVVLASKSFVSKDDVLNIYKFKTAKYTITLPVKLAFILCGREFSSSIELITDNIGILFQMKDDLLELEENSEVIGKSDTSDIRAGKQHHPRKVLESLASSDDLLLINKYYYVRDDFSVLELKKFYDKYGVVDFIKKEISVLYDETSRLISDEDSSLSVIFEKLLNYVINRRH